MSSRPQENPGKAHKKFRPVRAMRQASEKFREARTRCPSMDERIATRPSRRR